MLFFSNSQREDVFDRGFSVFLSVAFSYFGSLKGEMGIDVAKSKHSGPYGDANEKRKSPLQPFFSLVFLLLLALWPCFLPF